MAKVLFTAVVADMRNKLAGSVFARNRGGAYVRTKSSPLNAQTVAQTLVRQRLSGNSQDWRGLTPDERTQWNAATPNFPKTDQFGNQYFLSGQQLFIGLNNNLLNCGIAQITVPPVPTGVGAITALSVAMAEGAGTATATFTPTPVPANTSYILEATAPQSAGRSFFKNKYRQLAVIAAAGASPYNFAAAYITKFGAIGAAGTKISIRLTPINTTTGEAGASITADAIVAA